MSLSPSVVPLCVIFLCLWWRPLEAVWVSPYITWGTEAARDDHNWIGSLEYQGQPVGGCALVDENWVLTAARLVVGKAHTPQYFQAWLGVTDRSLILNQGEKYDIAEIIIHPDFINENYNGYPNDIAALRLTKPADLSDPYIDLIPMDSRPYNHPHDDCMIAGWGRTCGTCTVLPSALREVAMGVLQKDECKVFYGERLEDVHLCVKDQEGNASPCVGDGGTPLTCQDNDVTVLCGLLSWGESSNSCQGFYPAVYTRISYQCEWIHSITGAACAGWVTSPE